MESIKTLNQYIETLRKIIKDTYLDKNYRVYFRGEDKNYQKINPNNKQVESDTRCLPKSFRGIDERDQFYKYIRRHPEEFSGLSNLETLSKMQHYGIATRLLDITTNPLVALFFACGGARRDPFVKEEECFESQEKLSCLNDDINYLPSRCKWKDHNGYVYIFRTKVQNQSNQTNILTYDSDRALLLSTLVKMSENQKQLMSEFLEICISKGVKEITNDVLAHNEDFYNEHRNVFNRFIYECERERDAFKEHRVNPEDMQSIFFVKPSFQSLRIKLQSGLFIIFGLKYLSSSLDPMIDINYFRDKVINKKNELGPIIIDADSKNKILAELKFLCGISYASMFGDIDASVSEPKEKLYKEFKNSLIKD